jgi:hypothetical protein
MLKQVLAISLIAIFALPSHAADPENGKDLLQHAVNSFS